MTHTLQSALEMGQNARIAHIDFSPAFHGVKHPVICSVVSVGDIVSLQSVTVCRGG